MPEAYARGSCGILIRRSGGTAARRITVAEWQVIRRDGWTAGSGRCGWPGPGRPHPAPAGPGTSGSTGRGSSPRMRSGLVTKCGCAKTGTNASWSSCGSSPSGSARLLPPSAIPTTARPVRRARKLPRWLCAIAAQAVRPNATGAVSRNCSGGRPAEPGLACWKAGPLRRGHAPAHAARGEVCRRWRRPPAGLERLLGIVGCGVPARVALTLSLRILGGFCSPRPWAAYRQCPSSRSSSRSAGGAHRRPGA